MPILQILLFLCSGYGHMIMEYPPPRGYKGNTLYPSVDYNLMAPMASMPFCKSKPAGQPILHILAGDTIMVQFIGVARHGGGICQFSLSYDNDATFFAIAEYEGSCPDANYAWPVTVPATVPECKRCTFAWTWINAIGNREFYMDCADISIDPSPFSQATMTGPQILVANLPGYPIIQPEVGTGPPSSNKRALTPAFR